MRCMLMCTVPVISCLIMQVRVVEEYCSVNDFNSVVLTTGSIMIPAMKLYTSAGYEHWRKGFMPQDRREKLKVGLHVLQWGFILT